MYFGVGEGVVGTPVDEVGTTLLVDILEVPVDLVLLCEDCQNLSLFEVGLRSAYPAQEQALL